MRYTEIKLADAEDIEAFYLQTTGMKPGFLQLSSGPAGMQMHVVDLEGVSLIWAKVQGSTRWYDQFNGDGMHLGFALDSAGPVYVRGQELTGNEAQVWIPGQNIEYIMHGPVKTLEIGVSQELMNELGWAPCGEPLRQVGNAELKSLTQLCRHASNATDESVIERRDWVLEKLDSLLHSWTEASENRDIHFSGRIHHQLLRDSEHYFLSLEADEQFNVDRMADRLGIPRRTLFHAYRRLLGIGPRRYLELIRLQRLRRRLINASPGETTVTLEAQREGFFHAGRLPRTYREQFGESPADTLRSGQ
jgi:AraC-like DNA-binding protein